MADKEKSTWDSFKSGMAKAFQPADAAADERIAENRKEFGDQYSKDRDAGVNSMRSKFVKGFYGQ